MTSRLPSLRMMASDPGNSNSRGMRTARFRPLRKILTCRSGSDLAGICHSIGLVDSNVKATVRDVTRRPGVFREYVCESAGAKGRRAAIFGAVLAWFEQLSGFTEVIEVDARHLRLRKEIFGWERTREYSIEQCSELKLQDESGDAHGLQCRLGRWRTIEFGDYLTQQQALDVLSALDDKFPEIAPKLLPSEDITQHFTKLDLR